MFRIRVFAFIILLIALTPPLSYGQDISLMSYNIKYDNTQDTVNNWNDRKEKMVGLIEHYGPSFVGVQEALHRQLTYLDDSMADFTYIGVGRDDGKQGGEYSAILYDSVQFRVREHKTFWLSESPERPSVGWDAALERICTYGLFEQKETGKKLWVFNTHFDHEGEIAREKSAALIVTMLKKVNTAGLPVVLMGDLNLTPDQRGIQLIKTYLDDGLEKSETPPYGPGGTFNGFDVNRKLDRRIDYIFVKNLSVESYTHIDDRMENLKYISDHLPVLIRIQE